MKIHWVSAVAVMLVGMALPLPASARAVLLFAVILVLAAEVLNAAIEGLVDLATASWAFSAKRAKDAAAGVVLLLALGSVVLLADVLVHAWAVVEASGPAVRRTLLFGLPHLAALSALLAAPRRLLWLGPAAGLTFAFFVPLAAASEDPVFTLAALALSAGGGVARLREARLLDTKPRPAP
jgi:diacylglycerol kinase